MAKDENAQKDNDKNISIIEVRYFQLKNDERVEFRRMNDKHTELIYKREIDETIPMGGGSQ